MFGKFGKVGWLGGAGLFGARLGLVGILAILEFLNGRGLRVLAQRGLLCGLFLDIFERGSEDGTLDLARFSITLLGGCFGQSLLVQTTPGLRPYQFGGLFALNGQTKRLARAQPQGLAVPTNHQFTMTGINAVLGESTEFGCEEINNRN